MTRDELDRTGRTSGDTLRRDTLMRIFRSIAVVCCFGLSASLIQGAEPAPKVVTAWAVGPMEARIAFDRAVDPDLARAVVGRSVEFGEAAQAGAVGRPGGDRGALRIAASRLIDEGRTLVLVTDPHPREATYRLTLPGVKASGEPGPGTDLEVSYDLGGVEVAWLEKKGVAPSWSGWWPLIDSDAVRDLTAGSAEHEALRPWTQKPGILTLKTMINLPKGDVEVSVDAPAPFEATLGIETTRSTTSKPSVFRATLKAESTGDPIDLSLTLRTGEPGYVPSPLRVSSSSKPLNRSSYVLPWAPPPIPPASPSPIPPELLTGGDPKRGEVVFYGEEAKCANCHKVRDKGGIVGPDLTNLAGVDRSWVYRNIIEPSASIHPEYVSHTVLLKDGRVAMGVVRAEGAEALKVGDIEAKQTVIPRAEVEEVRASSSSVMPVGLLGAIGDERTRDLLAFLTAPAPKAPAR